LGQEVGDKGVAGLLPPCLPKKHRCDIIGTCSRDRDEGRMGENTHMRIATFEGIVEGGQIRLKADTHLPEKTKVYVIVPAMQAPKTAHIYSPHLVHPEQTVDFRMEIIETPANANL
jgi:hypothetical protein